MNVKSSDWAVADNYGNSPTNKNLVYHRYHRYKIFC